MDWVVARVVAPEVAGPAERAGVTAGVLVALLVAGQLLPVVAC